MVKKISYWTAAGQFLEMVERQLEVLRTDRAETPLSDYQDALNSVTSDLQVRSCPALTRALVPLNVRKTSSCPMAAFSCPLSARISEVQLNEATVMMVRFLESIYPMPDLRTEYTLFEKMDGFFTATPTPSIDTLAMASVIELPSPVKTEQPSLFEKVNGFFEETEWCPLPRNTPVEGLFVDDTITSGLSVWSSRPQTYYCPSCKAWSSLDNPSVPQLPVFVKSPLDSLKIYECNRSSPVSGEMADDELTVYVPLSPTPSPVPSTSSTSSDDTYKNVRSIANPTSSASDVTTLIPLDRLVAARLREAALRQQIAVQEEVIEKQKAIIDAFTELNTLSKKLSEVKA